LPEEFGYIFIKTTGDTGYLFVVVALGVDAGLGHPVADACGLECDFNRWVILHAVEIHDAEGASAELTAMQVPHVVVEYLTVEGLWGRVLGLARVGNGNWNRLIYVLPVLVNIWNGWFDVLFLFLFFLRILWSLSFEYTRLFVQLLPKRLVLIEVDFPEMRRDDFDADLVGVRTAAVDELVEPVVARPEPHLDLDLGQLRVEHLHCRLLRDRVWVLE
jgi:hypothetical protein